MDFLETPIGNLPKYDDLKTLFKEIIDKEYPKALYDKQFSLYTENIIKRIELQEEAYSKEEAIPARLFEILAEQKKGILALQDKKGAVVLPKDLEA